VFCTGISSWEMCQLPSMTTENILGIPHISLYSAINLIGAQ
jgi:hypothetical protein